MRDVICGTNYSISGIMCYLQYVSISIFISVALLGAQLVIKTLKYYRDIKLKSSEQQ
jgi:hypothetical protein